MVKTESKLTFTKQKDKVSRDVVTGRKCYREKKNKAIKTYFDSLHLDTGIGEAYS